MAFTRSELRFGKFLKPCILDVVQGKLQRSVRKFAVLKIYNVEPDPNVLKHHDFQIIFCSSIALFLVNTIQKFI